MSELGLVVLALRFGQPFTSPILRAHRAERAASTPPASALCPKGLDGVRPRPAAWPWHQQWAPTLHHSRLVQGDQGLSRWAPGLANHHEQDQCQTLVLPTLPHPKQQPRRRGKPSRKGRVLHGAYRCRGWKEEPAPSRSNPDQRLNRSTQPSLEG